MGRCQDSNKAGPLASSRRLATDLVACRAPLVQVLSLPPVGVKSRHGGLVQFGELLRALAASSPEADPRRSP